jgi:RNA polymerase sigma-70 factor (ECF subfamily)
LAVQRTLQGDTEAFSDIVERYTPVLFSLAIKSLTDREEAEDTVQEVFLNAFRSLHRFSIEARFYTWLYTIAVNNVRSRLRKRYRSFKMRSLDAENAPVLRDGRVDVELSVVTATEEERAAKALDILNPDYRIVFILRFIEGKSLKEIANTLDLPVGTVKARIHRARKKLIGALT